MKNKILCLLCGMMLAVGLTACGDKNTTEVMKESTNSKATQENTQEGEEQPVKEPESKEPEVKLDKDGNIDYWIVKKMEPPEIPTITNVREVSIRDGVTVKIGMTPIDYDFQEIEHTLRNNDFLKENYDLAVERDEYFDTFSDEYGDFWSCYFTDYVKGSYKGTRDNGAGLMQDFYYSIGRDTESYDNYSSVEVVFKKVKVTEDLQEQIYGILKDTLGQKIGEFMVYGGAKDDDYDDYEILIEAKDEEKEQIDKYYIQREVDIDLKEMTADISFIYKVANPHYYNRFWYYDGDYVSRLSESPYNMSAITNGGLSDFNMEEFKEYASEYMNIVGDKDYIQTYLSIPWYDERTDDWGGKRYKFWGLFRQGYSIYNDFNKDEPALSVQYVIYELNDDIHTIDLEFSGEVPDFTTENKEDESYKRQVLDIMRQQMAMVVPGVDVSRITYENIQNAKNASVKIEVPYTLLGKECKCAIIVDDYEEWEVDITYGKE